MSNKGFSLVEIAVVMAIMGVLGLGSATLMKNLFQNQNRVKLRASIHQVRLEMVSLLKSETAWRNTFNNAANNATLGCLRSSQENCTTSTVNDFTIFDAEGNLFYDSTALANGFAPDGSNCNTYAVAGNDNCPFRFALRVDFTCPPASPTCANPSILVTGQMAYSPNDRSDTSTRLNADDYDFVVTIGERALHERVSFGYVGNTSQNCSTAWTQANINTVFYDDASLVTVAANNFTLARGRYFCKVMVQAYNVTKGFRARLIAPGGPYHIGNGYSRQNTFSTVNGHAIFTSNGVTPGRIEYRCETAGASGTPRIDFDTPALIDTQRVVECERLTDGQ